MPGAPSGLYWLDPDGVGVLAPFAAYCDMVGDGGGWTLVMKVDGNSPLLTGESALWQDMSLISADKPDFDKQQARLPGYAQLPLTQLRVGLTVDASPPATLVLAVQGSSLGYLISQGKLIATSAGRQNWKSLLVDSSLQMYCSQEGLNTIDCRIGISSNQENDCASPDSWLGIGCVGGFAAGNFADGNWSPDNGAKATKAFGYVWVR